MTIIDIYRKGELYASVKPTDSSSLTKKIMGDNVVTLSFELDKMVNFNVGDYCTIYGDVYTLNSMPVDKKTSKFNYEYDLTLQSTQHTLSKAQFLFLDNNNNYQKPDFTFTGTAEKFIDIIVTNVSRVDAGWARGGVVQDVIKTISFSGENCFDALKKIAQEFDIEYFIEGKRINLARQERQTIYKFEYGRNRGLYDITRTQQQETAIITRVYAYGGTTNIPFDYRNFSDRLLLPSVPEENVISNLSARVISLGPTKTFWFHWIAPHSEFVTSIIVNYRLVGTTEWTGNDGPVIGDRILHLPNGNYEFYFSSVTATEHFDTAIVAVTGSILTPIFTTANKYYLENNVEKYGVIEKTLIFDDIFPERIGKVSSVDATNVYKFGDSSIDFDINEYLLPGLAAKVTFNSGQLTGYTFEINRFDVELKEFTILKNKDEKTIDVPSNSLNPAIGDEYVLTDIRLPQEYITAAENLLYSKALEYVRDSSEAKFNYAVNGEKKLFRSMKIRLNLGDVVSLFDAEFQVNSRIRVVSITRSLFDEYDYSFELGDVIKPSKVAQILSGQNYNELLINNLRAALEGNRLLSGTNIGNFRIEQGGLNIPDIPVGTGTPIYIDANGNVVRGG